MGGEHRTLFLHGGPGLNAGVERLWFRNNLPVCWWDQPPVASGSPAPFGQLVAAATDRLRAISGDAGEPVTLIAHSLGSRIAHALAREAPELVGRIILLGCTPDIFPQFFRVFRRMAQIQSSPALEDAIAAAEAHLDIHSFETMFLAAVTHPAFPAVYFGPNSKAALDRFLPLLQQVEQLLNMETLLAVMNELLSAPALAPASNFNGEVTLLLGRHDPLLAVDEDIATWRRIFPQLQAQIVDCGHLVHLELPPGIWWEGSNS